MMKISRSTIVHSFLPSGYSIIVVLNKTAYCVAGKTITTQINESE